MININHTVQGVDFEWDADKAFHNQIKHGISFEIACNTFFDPFLISLDDEVIDSEIRHTAVGMSTIWHILYIVYVWRGDTIRLISTRPTTTHERRTYEDR